MFYKPAKILLLVAITSILGLAPARMLAQATPAAQEPQKNWKDRAEYDLYVAITGEKDAKARLEKLQAWEKQYQQTDYIKERRTLFLTTYFALSQAKEAVGTAKQILADDPKNFSALYIMVNYTQSLAGNPPAPDVMDQGEKAANTLLANIDTPPANFTADTWKSQRPQVEELAHTTIGWVEMQKKNWQPAEDEFQKALKLDPNSGQLAYYMGTAIASEKDVKKMPTALFYFARAATYDGQGSLNAQGRQQVMDYVKKAYKGYHGADDGFDKLISAAKASATPTGDILSIKSATEMAEASAKNEADWESSHPEAATWKKLKDALSAADGENYFNTGMKDAQLPKLKGKVVKLEPATKPKTILIALEDGKSDGSSADATLKFEAALPGSVEPGTELTFEGVPESFTASPFMVVFNVDKEKLYGWTGKNAPAPPKKRPTTAEKK